MATKIQLQPYPREGNTLLSAHSLYPKKKKPLSKPELNKCIDNAFERCLLNKKGERKPKDETPESIVKSTIKHLKERSDPILGPLFISQLEVEDFFELDAVSFEMQRHRMTIGVFYQYLILELMRKTWHVFDGSRDGNIIADVDTAGFNKGLRLYMSVKKSKDTIGGQDIGRVIRRIENEAQLENNLSRPYLCVIAIATPSQGKLKDHLNDRTIKTNRLGQPYSLNCEFWGPEFTFPYMTGLKAFEIYRLGIKRVVNYLPFMTSRFRKECAKLLKQELTSLCVSDKTIFYRFK